MFSRTFLKRCQQPPPPPAPKGLITTNIVGGLGNQLFLIANLLATANRNNLIPYLPVAQLPESSSCFEPRPTYWNTPMMSKNLLSSAVYQSVEEATLRLLIEQETEVARRNSSKNEIDESMIQNEAIQKFLKLQQQNQNQNSNNDIQLVPELGADAKHIILNNVNENKSSSSFPHYSLGGFFQSDRYFSDFSSSIAQILCPEELVSASQKSLKNGLLLSGGKNQNENQNQQHVVALHVRRGDYLKLKETFEILDAESYYFEAIEKLFGTMLFSRKFGFSSSSSNTSTDSYYGQTSGCFKPLFRLLIFCDEQENSDGFAQLLRGALEVKYPTIQASIVVSKRENNNESSCVYFPDLELSSESNNQNEKIPQDMKEMLIMSQCDDLIIANSSFSWWSAFFAKNAICSESNNNAGDHQLRRIVAPQKWFVGKQFSEQVHIYGSDWIVI